MGIQLCSATMALLAVTAGSEGPPKPRQPLRVEVRVFDYAQLPTETLGRAQKVAGRILRAAGVEAAWHNCAMSAGEPGEDLECEQLRTATDLVLRMLPRDIAGRLVKDRGIYGYALPADKGEFPCYANLFYHRIDDLAKGQSVPCSLFLGHFLAHEIGHLLLGPDSHARTGIMSVPFGKLQVRGACWGTLQFTPGEAARIRSEVLKRVEATLRPGEVRLGVQ